MHVSTHELAQWPFSHYTHLAATSRKTLVLVERKSTAWPHIVKDIGNATRSGSSGEPKQNQPGQTRTQSMLETITNIGTGFLLSLVVTFYVFPWYGHHVTHSENLQITAIFTLVSIVRSYFFRRIFNHIQVKP